jgi:hypothetical protein
MWGEYQIFINEPFKLIIYDLIYFLNCSIASYLYTIFQYQTCVYWTKDQYDRSHELLSEILKSKWCKDCLSDVCIHMIEKFQTSIKEIKKYLAFYIHSKISMSFDAMTSSPVKSINSALKNGM